MLQRHDGGIGGRCCAQMGSLLLRCWHLPDDVDVDASSTTVLLLMTLAPAFSATAAVFWLFFLLLCGFVFVCVALHHAIFHASGNRARCVIDEVKLFFLCAGAGLRVCVCGGVDRSHRANPYAYRYNIIQCFRRRPSAKQSNRKSVNPLTKSPACMQPVRSVRASYVIVCGRAGAVVISTLETRASDS